MVGEVPVEIVDTECIRGWRDYTICNRTSATCSVFVLCRWGKSGCGWYRCTSLSSSRGRGGDKGNRL
jgi:hypothetical protein